MHIVTFNLKCIYRVTVYLPIRTKEKKLFFAHLKKVFKEKKDIGGKENERNDGINEE